MGLDDSEQRLGRKGFGQVGVCPNQSPFEAIKHPVAPRNNDQHGLRNGAFSGVSTIALAAFSYLDTPVLLIALLLDQVDATVLVMTYLPVRIGSHLPISWVQA